MCERHSNGFEEEKINEYLRVGLDEGVLIDRKRDLWKVGNRAAEFPEDSCQVKDRGKFIKHVIAMANAARRRGKDAYILFGIDDYGNWNEDELENIVGVCRQTLTLNLVSAEDWQRKLNNPEEFSRFQRQINNTLYEIANRYISPKPTIDYEWGYISYQDKHGLLSYLRIGKTAQDCFKVIDNPSARVRRELEQIRECHSTLRTIRAGACFMRKADSTVPEDCSNLVSYQEIPFIDVKQWRNYQASVRASLTNLVPEITWPTSIREKNKVYAFERHMWSWLEDDESSRVFLLEGLTGIGKTVNLCKWSLELLEEMNKELNVTRPGTTPNTCIPTYVTLKGVRDSEDLEKRLGATLNWEGTLNGNAVEIIEVLHDKELKFVVIFDGVDEMNTNQNRNSIIANIVQKYPVRYVIASRPGWLKPDSETWKRYPLRSAALETLQSEIVESELPCLDFIEEPWSGDLRETLHIPLYLKCFQDQVDDPQGSENGNLGLTLCRLSTHLFEHAGKNLANDREVRNYQRSLRRIAWSMAKSHNCIVGFDEVKEFCDEHALAWMLEAGLLRETEDAIDLLEFSVKVFFWYWAAREMLRQLQHEFTTINRSVTQGIREFEGIFRVAMNLYINDFTIAPICSWFQFLSYPWLLLILRERQFQNITNTSIFHPAIQEAVEQEDIGFLKGLLEDPLLSIKLITVQLICEKPRMELIRQLMKEKQRDWIIQLNEQQQGEAQSILEQLVTISSLWLDSV